MSITASTAIVLTSIVPTDKKTSTCKKAGNHATRYNMYRNVRSIKN